MAPDRGMAEDVPFREGPQGRREPHPTPFFLPGPNASPQPQTLGCLLTRAEGRPAQPFQLPGQAPFVPCLPWETGSVETQTGPRVCPLCSFLYVRVRLSGFGPLVALNSRIWEPPLSSEAPPFPYPCIFSVNPGLTSHFSPKLKFPTQAHGACDPGPSGVPEPESTSSLLPSGKSTGP